MKFKNIGIILGTRPEAIKLIPLYQKFKENSVTVQLISTGQHQSMLEQIFDFFQINPDVSLNVMVHNQSLSGLTARLTTAMQECFDENNYDLIIVQGDTTTAMVASLVAYYNRIPVAHIEAGLRTYNKFSPFPEEVNRQIIGRIADYHFAPTNKAFNVLKDEGIKNIYEVGNTVIDSLLLCIQKIEHKKEDYKSLESLLTQFKKTILITGHRRENFGGGFDEICKAIKELAFIYPDCLFYYPVHLNPNVKDKVHTILDGLPNIKLDHPLPYDKLIYLMSKSYIILTDSGGIQEEAPSLNVPVLVMRDTTERPEGIENGCAKLVGAESKNIIAHFRELMENDIIYNTMSIAQNPYGDGQTSLRIVEILSEG